MSIKKEYLFLLVIIVILAAYILFHKSDQMHYQLPELPKLKTKDITKLEISQPEQKTTLKRSNGQWTIEPEGYQASQTQVQKLLDSVSDLRFTALASTSRTYDRYELSKSERILVKVWQEDNLVRSFYIGKAGENYSTAFVKLTDDPNIYVVSSNLKNKFSQDKSQLRDKTVLSFDRTKIETVNLKSNNRQIAIMKQKIPANKTQSANGTGSAKQYDWKTEGKTRVVSKEVDKLLGLISDLHCSKYLPEESKISDLKLVCTISLKNKVDYLLKLYLPESGEREDKGQKRYTGTSSGSQDPFILAQSTGDQIVKSVESLLKETNAASSE